MTMISGELMPALTRTQPNASNRNDALSYCPYTETLAHSALIHPHLQRHLVQIEIWALPSPNHLPSQPLALD